MSTRREFINHTVASVISAAASAKICLASTETTVEIPKTLMMTHKVPHTELVVSRMAYGCGMLGVDAQGSGFVAKTETMINTAYDQGITLFDMAEHDRSASEVILGQVLEKSPGLRHNIVIQSKCGIVYNDDPKPVAKAIDLSHEHIISAAEGSLKRIGTDYLDILLLHEPDELVQPDEVARAFDELKHSGKVRYFGVSNYIPIHIELLKTAVRQPLVVNQFQLSLVNFYPALNYPYGGSHYMLETGIVDYCRLNSIQVQAWSPLRGSLVSPTADDTPAVKHVATLLADMAVDKKATPAAVALAWLMRHPAGIVPILGSSNPQHLIEDCAADRVTLSREEWYALFAAGAAIQS